MPARDYGPPPGLLPEERVVWAVKQIETATTEGEIRAAMRVLMNTGAHKVQRSFIVKVRQRLLEVGALPPDNWTDSV